MSTAHDWSAGALGIGGDGLPEGAKGVELKEVAQPARVALTGRSASPGIFEVLEVLGKDLALARLDRAIASIAAAPSTGP